MLTLLLLALMSSDKDPFLRGSAKDIFQRAKTENKLILVDVYTTWCGPCRMMDQNTFKDETVRDFLKEKLISYKVDAEKGGGVAFARKYKVPGYPCFLLLDSEGKLIAQKLGYMPPNTFLSWLKSTF